MAKKTSNTPKTPKTSKAHGVVTPPSWVGGDPRGNLPHESNPRDTGGRVVTPPTTVTVIDRTQKNPGRKTTVKTGGK